MHICGIEKFSMVDYPQKIACTVFTSGCDFKCPFCYNAPLVECGDEVTVPLDEVFDYLKNRKKLVDAVCVSGGEPTLQPDLVDFIKKVKDMGFLVKLDTNGTRPKVLKSLLDARLLDYVAMDIKSGKSGYSEVAGVNVDFSLIQESVNALLHGDIDYEFRTTLVAEFHTASDMREIGELIRGAKHYYLQKFTDKDTCIRAGLHTLPQETAEEFKNILQTEFSLDAKLRNYD